MALDQRIVGGGLKPVLPSGIRVFATFAGRHRAGPRGIRAVGQGAPGCPVYADFRRGAPAALVRSGPWREAAGNALLARTPGRPRRGVHRSSLVRKRLAPCPELQDTRTAAQTARLPRWRRGGNVSTRGQALARASLAGCARKIGCVHGLADPHRPAALPLPQMRRKAGMRAVFRHEFGRRPRGMDVGAGSPGCPVCTMSSGEAK